MNEWWLLLIPFIVLAGAAIIISISLMIRRGQARAYRQRAYFQDRYGYRFDALLANHHVDLQGLDALLRQSESGAEKKAIRYVQIYEDVPDHVAREFVRSVTGERR